jgi:TM2 domain-containing membrane protein YozV
MKVEMLLTTLNSMLPEEKITHIEEILSLTEEEKIHQIKLIPFQDPSKLFFTALFLGVFGIDRFVLGDNIYGLLKLLTLGGIGIWIIYDCYTIVKRTKAANYCLLCNVLNNKIN